MVIICKLTGYAVDASEENAKKLLSSGAFRMLEAEKPAPKKRAAQKKAPAKEQ